MEEICQRKTSDRRGNDRRMANVTVYINRWLDQRRSGGERREMVTG